jgi:fructose-1,6-bisphosphatase
MAFLVEQAGGRASTGAGRVLEVQPTELHQRCSIWLGSPDNVDDVDAAYAAAAGDGSGK